MVIDTILAAARVLLVTVGLIAAADPAATVSFVTVTVALLSVALLFLATISAVSHAPGRGSPPHPTRTDELSAPLAQCDPDAAGHVRRRGPGPAASAA